MKNLLLFFFLCVFSFHGSSQVVTGVYKGKMEVDSPKYTVDFELTLKEKNGKLYGYCHRLFIVNDILYYNLVKVNARIADSVLIVEDEKSVSNNFKENTSGVKTVMFFTIQKDNDTVSVMPGEWSTSRTKRYLPITGKIAVKREENYLSTQLYKKLEDNKLDKEMAFEEKTKPQQPLVNIPVKTETKPVLKPTVILPTPEPTQPAITKAGQQTKQQNSNPSVAANQPKQNLPTAPVVNKPAVDSSKLIAATGNEIKQQTNNPSVAANQPKQNLPTKPVVTKPPVVPGKDSAQAIAINQNKQQPKPAVVTNPVEKTKQQPVTQAAQKQQPVSNQPVVQTTAPQQQPVAVLPEKKAATITKIGDQHDDTVSTNKPLASTTQPVINNPVIVKRSLEIIQTIDIAQDSVVLSLYDNGEIDGDTVSVFLNNELLISKAGLSARAFKKTIYFRPGETIQLTLFAENLGAIPPNTGLLMITTETERYQVFFSSSYNKSSSVLLRRKE